MTAHGIEPATVGFKDRRINRWAKNDANIIRNKLINTRRVQTGTGRTHGHTQHGHGF